MKIKSLRDIYYLIKPMIPRPAQIALRSSVVRRKRRKFINSWPINSAASRKPADWKGWPHGKEFALILTHDVDTKRGHQRVLDLMELEMRLGFRSSFNFVPERYSVYEILRRILRDNGFEIGVHGLKHDGKYFLSESIFKKRAQLINRYLVEWKAYGYRSPSMQHNLEWFHNLNIQYDASTFDTDPFEPQPDCVETIFPFWVAGNDGHRGYVELPYTLPQDFTLFVLLKERDTTIWRDKVDWIARHGGMALMNTHPDYMNFDRSKMKCDEYPADYYGDFLAFLKSNYHGKYWHALPHELARFYAEEYQGLERIDTV